MSNSSWTVTCPFNSRRVFSWGETALLLEPLISICWAVSAGKATWQERKWKHAPRLNSSVNHKLFVYMVFFLLLLHIVTVNMDGCFWPLVKSVLFYLHWRAYSAAQEGVVHNTCQPLIAWASGHWPHSCPVVQQWSLFKTPRNHLIVHIFSRVLNMLDCNGTELSSHPLCSW